METKVLNEAEKKCLLDAVRREIGSAPGRKVLEFGSGSYSLAAELRNELEYLACTDKSAAGLEAIRTIAESMDIHLIPDGEMSEDCYFGRFHLVYTLFGFHGLPHLVDEIMRLRRLILKGGKMVVIGFPENNFADECIKQLRRCGFTSIRTEAADPERGRFFLIAAEK